MDILKYQGYEGTAELDMSRGVCRGKILFIDDLVTYESDSPRGLKKEFEDAVEDYLETCKMLNREPKKPMRGQFNVRIPPMMHKEATLLAVKKGVALNDIVVRALDFFLHAQSEINHNVKVTVSIPEESIKTLLSSPSTGQQWETITNVQH
jgi:predicted HicB family RNase H-like nuclease